MMDTLIAQFPAQLSEALKIAEETKIGVHPSSFNKVYVVGMGGSGIAANFVASFVAEECKVPFLLGKSYSIPAYVDKHTLFIASSYSGNTEETLAAVRKAASTGAKIVVLTSGGALMEFAQSHHCDTYIIPENSPAPRAFIGYSIVGMLSILQQLDVIGNKALGQVKASADLIKYDMDEIKNKAEKIAQIIGGKMPAIYVEDRMEAVALRFRQQLNENSKCLSWHHTIPEMTHNELVAWTEKSNKLAVIFFRNKDDFKRNAMRMDYVKEVVTNYSNTVVEIYSKGKSLVEKSLYFLHLADWISWYLATSKNVDALNIEVIDRLKSELSKV